MITKEILSEAIENNGFALADRTFGTIIDGKLLRACAITHLYCFENGMNNAIDSKYGEVRGSVISDWAIEKYGINYIGFFLSGFDNSIFRFAGNSDEYKEAISAFEDGKSCRELLGE